MPRTLMIAIGISTALILIVIFNHNLAFQKNGTIVLPAGGTYLGPSSSPTTPSLPPLPISGGTIIGQKYPYSFKTHESVKLVALGGEFDIYALVIGNQPPENNVLIGVDDLDRTSELKKYINGTKRAYVENWWKQFSALKGITSIDEFTNSKGMKGYKVVYVNGSTEDVFFETGNPEHVIHLANGPLDKEIFDAIVDSVEWKK